MNLVSLAAICFARRAAWLAPPRLPAYALTAVKMVDMSKFTPESLSVMVVGTVLVSIAGQQVWNDANLTAALLEQQGVATRSFVAEQIGALNVSVNTQFNSLNASMNAQFNSLNAQFNSLNAQFNSLNASVTKIESRCTKLSACSILSLHRSRCASRSLHRPRFSAAVR
jgi:uncharacterized protein YdcH (DUF465 family)